MQKTKSALFLRATITALVTGATLSACLPTEKNTPIDSPVIVKQEKPEQDVALVKRSKHYPVIPAAVTDSSMLQQQIKQQQRMTLSTVKNVQFAESVVSDSRFRGSIMPVSPFPFPAERIDRENYQHFDDNAIKRVVENPLSTFSIDVDTGSYSNVRRMINAGNLPRRDAVRVEEMINYFSYDYAQSVKHNDPFSVSTELAVTPWNPDTRLLHIGIKAHDIGENERPASNLVFLIDVSGSMNSPHKLGLLKSALKLLSKNMRAQDRVSIVVYAGASGVVLEPVPGNQSAKIEQALNSLAAGGSTHGAAGIRSAYLMAQQAFIKGGINRVILATDGDFNVGTVNFEALKDLIAEKRKTGISLTTLGFGRGNYNDQLMEQLADAGNGNYAYIDTLNEAQKVLVDEINSTLNTVASDVKIQIEFNPAVVAEYRLIGYENRRLNREDFNNDNVDAGEIGAGHTVTALYEISLSNSPRKALEPLRYASKVKTSELHANELASLRLRYKAPNEKHSLLIEQLVNTTDIKQSLSDTSNSFRFAAAVAGFGQLLRGGKYTAELSYDNVLELARQSRGQDNFGYRGEFISLVNLAASLSSKASGDMNNNVTDDVQALK